MVLLFMPYVLKFCFACKYFLMDEILCEIMLIIILFFFFFSFRVNGGLSCSEKP
jgi:hypothetical protein